MADSTLVDRARKAVEMAQAAGADAVSARANRSREVEYEGRDGAIEKVQENTSRSLSIDLYVDGRYSTHSTTSLREDRLSSFVKEAVALTRALEPDPDRQLPDPKLYEGASEADLELVDDDVDAIEHDARAAWLTALDEGARADERVISATGYVGHTRGESAQVTSNGLEATNGGTQLWLGASTTVRDEGDARPEGGYWVGTRQLGDMLDAKAIATEALERAIKRLGTAKGPTQKTTMIVDPQTAGRLVSMLIGPARASSIHQGRSFWKGKLGQKLFPERLTLIDDPLLPRGLGSRPRDGEGLALKKRAIIDKGVVAGLYVDTYYGRKAGLEVSSSARTNVLVQPEVDKGLAELLADAGSGVYVTSWLGGNSDGTTGDFSLGLRGHLVEGGKVGAPVGEMNVTGSLVELFASLAVVGNDPWPFRSMRVPTLVFEGVQFSGA